MYADLGFIFMKKLPSLDLGLWSISVKFQEQELKEWPKLTL